MVGFDLLSRIQRRNWVLFTYVVYGSFVHQGMGGTQIPDGMASDVAILLQRIITPLFLILKLCYDRYSSGQFENHDHILLNVIPNMPTHSGVFQKTCVLCFLPTCL